MTALAASVASADVNLTLTPANMDGWKATATQVYGGTTDASVTQTLDYGGGLGNFRFYTGPMNTSWKFQWASISSDAFAGKTLASITSVRIKNYGVSGDNVNNWQPPTFTWVLDKDGAGNQRCIQWQPWSNGNARAPGAWHEYDAATTGRWLIEETGVYYNSLAALKAALPLATFEQSADLPVAYGYASQQAFNVGNCPLYDEDRAWFSNARGYVDWFEVGVDNVVTRYDLGYVPEPSSLALLAFGLGLVALRKKN